LSALWIKICGMTTPEAVVASLDARVDAIGFVFAESVRRLTPERAVQLAAAARGRIKCIAVTRHPTQSAIDEILKILQPDVLQTDVEDLPRLELPRQLEILPVMRAGHDEPANLPQRVLFEGPSSGTGILCDWSDAKELAAHARLVLAGGLNPENVAEAVASVRPFGVDVSSGVEQQPGVKSIARIAAFVAAARATVQEKSA
jgi:phosphoribosylanthranilate isomerase